MIRKSPYAIKRDSIPVRHGAIAPGEPARRAAESLSHGVKGLEDDFADRYKCCIVSHLRNIARLSHMG